MPSLLYYISGHGFGHARRCAETIKLLNETRPELQIHVRTMARSDVFAGCRISFEQVAIDRGAVEIDAVTIDWSATLADVRELIAGKDSLAQREADYIRRNDVGLVLADVPFMAGYVAEAAGVPCFAHCNFMWDWIYEPHTADRDLLESIRGGYRRMAGWLRLPFPHPCDHFRKIIDLPFITSPLTLTPQQAKAALGIGEGEERPIVLIGMRGGTGEEILKHLRSSDDRYLFITAKGPVFDPAAESRTPLRFWDALQVCAAVVSKPGHGIVTDCATMGVGLLYPPRNGFREDAMILGQGSRYFRQQEIPLSDYGSGNWAPYLDRMLLQAKPAPASHTHGREAVAQFIAEKLP